MKIIVFSDSHGKAVPMKHIMEQNARRCDVFIHLGDGNPEFERMREDFPNVMFSAVSGNCDIGSPAPKTDLLSIGGYRFFLTHGHMHKVASGDDNLLASAKERDADVVLYGHTHVCRNLYIPHDNGGVYLFNPGSISRPRGAPHLRSYGVIEIAPGGILLNCAYLPVDYTP